MLFRHDHRHHNNRVRNCNPNIPHFHHILASIKTGFRFVTPRWRSERPPESGGDAARSTAAKKRISRAEALAQRRRSQAVPGRLVLLSFRAHCVAVNDTMRFVVAGLGWWGRSWMDVLKIHPKVQLVAIIDPSDEAREWNRENLAIAHF